MTGNRTFGNVRRRQSGKYQARYTGPDGVTYSTEPATFDTKAAADAALARISAEIQAGKWRQSDLRLIDERIAAWTRGYRADRGDYGEVYFARARDICKIGWSRDTDRRLLELRTSDQAWPGGVARCAPELLAVLPGPEGLEKELHLIFGSLRVGREWFRLAPPLSTYVAQIAEQMMADMRDPVKAAAIRKKVRKTAAREIGRAHV